MEFNKEGALVYKSGNAVIWETVTVEAPRPDHLAFSGYDLIPIGGSFRRMAWNLKQGNDGWALVNFGFMSFEGYSVVSAPAVAKATYKAAQRLFIKEVAEETGVVVGRYGASTTVDVIETLAASEGAVTEVASNLTRAPAAGHQLHVAVGEGAEALANSVGAIRGAGQTYVARIPTALIQELERIGLATRSPLIMQNSAGQIVGKGTQIEFHSSITKYIVPFFH